MENKSVSEWKTWKKKTGELATMPPAYKLRLRQRQEDCVWKDILGYIVKTCLRKTKQTTSQAHKHSKSPAAPTKVERDTVQMLVFSVPFQLQHTHYQGHSAKISQVEHKRTPTIKKTPKKLIYIKTGLYF